jgi:hypothetical protein
MRPRTELGGGGELRAEPHPLLRLEDFVGAEGDGAEDALEGAAEGEDVGKEERDDEFEGGGGGDGGDEGDFAGMRWGGGGGVRVR